MLPDDVREAAERLQYHKDYRGDAKLVARYVLSQQAEGECERCDRFAAAVVDLWNLRDCQVPPDVMAAIREAEAFRGVPPAPGRAFEFSGGGLREDPCRRVITVRLPARLHRLLLAEAERRNVTLNWLCIAKLIGPASIPADEAAVLAGLNALEASLSESPDL